MSGLTLDETIRGLQTLESQLDEWRAVVGSIEAREKEIAQARAKVREIEGLIDAFKSAVTATLAAEAEAKEAEVKAAKRRELGAQIRKATARMDELAREVLELNDAEPLARGAVAGAQERLVGHLNNLLAADNYPTKSELDAERATGKRLQAAYDAAVAAVGTIVERLTKARMAWLRVRDEVNTLTWQESRLRPPDNPGAHDLRGGAFRVQ